MIQNQSRLFIAATPATVWKVLTDPGQVKLWQYGSDLLTDWQPGHPIRFRTAWNDTVFEQWGMVLEYQPEVLLRYSLFAPRPDLADQPENYFTMTYRLTEVATGVELEILQDDPRLGAAQEDPQGEENPVLAALKALAEQ